MVLVWVGLALLGVILFIGLLLHFLEGITFFKKELRRINNEIKRTDGSERARWKRRKKRLILSILPFFRY